MQEHRLISGSNKKTGGIASRFPYSHYGEFILQMKNVPPIFP